MTKRHQLRHLAAPLLISLSLSVAAGCGGRAASYESDGSGGAAPTTGGTASTKGGRTGANGGRSAGGQSTDGGVTTWGGSTNAGGWIATGGTTSQGGSMTEGGSIATGGCVYGGIAHEANESFKALDGCNTCTCYGGGSVGCTAIACTDSCSVLRGSYQQVLSKAKSCNPASVSNPCAQRVATLPCDCHTMVNAGSQDAVDILNQLHLAHAQNGCDATVDCELCAQPAGGFCNASGQCQDWYDAGQGQTSCLVRGTVYPHGATQIKDPFSCNLCECSNGQLLCTEIACGVPCSTGAIAGSRCVQCGPAGGCNLVETGCFAPCRDGDCQAGQLCTAGFCEARCL